MNSWSRNLIWAGLGLVFLTSLYLVIILGIWFVNSDKIMPGVTIAGVQYSGQSDAIVLESLMDRTSGYLSSGNPYKIEYDLEATLVDAKKAIPNPFQLGTKRDIPIRFSFSQAALSRDLLKSQKKYQREVINPKVMKEASDFKADKGSYGLRVIYGENTFRFLEGTGQLKGGFRPRVTKIEPAYNQAILEENLASVRIPANGLVLGYRHQNFQISPERVATWLGGLNEELPLGSRLSGTLVPAILEARANKSIFDSQKVASYLTEVAKKIDREPVNATLKMVNGKAAIFSLSQTGLSLNIDENVLNIIEALENGNNKVDLMVDETQPEITRNSLEGLGIVGLVAEGRSNFSGSPSNRRHNIKVGASKFDGMMIKPGETFSFTETLGPVDASTGYLPELVIKDNETVPEFGGGLCQVSSTIFRAALNAGLPIVARRPHAYPVPYYRPWGTDATIYIPNPDLKFINDTGHYILIQTRIAGSYLYFDFYGTKKTITVRFAGNEKGEGRVSRVENVTPYLYDLGVSGSGSFTAVFWQFIYDSKGKLIEKDSFVSKYDSPLKYPH